MRKNKTFRLTTLVHGLLVQRSGQAALVILAVMAIGMTVAMSLSQRVLTDMRISEQEESSSKAFSAAEAGIEEALRQLDQGQTDVSIDPQDLGVNDVAVSVLEQGGNSQFTYPISVRPGEIAIFWLRDHNSDGSLNLSSGWGGGQATLCWQEDAAIEAIYFYLDGSNQTQIKHFAIDPQARSNGFVSSPVGSCFAITELNRSYDLDLTEGTPIMLVVRPFYATTRVGLALSSGNLPSQGYLITSTGAVEASSEQNISRRIRVFRSWNVPDSSLFQAVFGTGVSGN